MGFIVVVGVNPAEGYGSTGMLQRSDYGSLPRGEKLLSLFLNVKCKSQKISVRVLFADGRSLSPRMDARSLISETGSAHLVPPPAAAAAYPSVIVSTRYRYRNTSN
jgi:hypothetical protein